jgi:hypothetical protein
MRRELGHESAGSILIALEKLPATDLSVRLGRAAPGIVFNIRAIAELSTSERTSMLCELGLVLDTIR